MNRSRPARRAGARARPPATPATPPPAVSATADHAPTEPVGAPPDTLALGDHVEIARKLIDQLRAEAGTAASPVFDRGVLRNYDPTSGLWRDVPRHVLTQRVAAFSGAAIPRGETVAKLKLKSHDIAGTINVIYELVARPGFFDAAPVGVTFANGFVRLDPADPTRLELAGHSPDHRATYALAFDYDPAAEAPGWQRFLDDVFTHPSELVPEDQGGATTAERAALAVDRHQRIDVLEEWIGACLLGTVVKYQVVIALHGEGSNGKSVFLEVVRNLFSPALVRSIRPQKWSDKFTTAGLDGCLVNMVNEVPATEISASDVFKSMIAGDAIGGEKKYKDPYTFKPRAGHIFAFNKFPGTDDQSHGFWRRWIVLLFERLFDERNANKNLTAALTTPDELCGIAARVLRAVARLEARGHLVIPASAEDAKAEWRMDADQVMQFVAECCDTCHLTHTQDCGAEDDLCHAMHCERHRVDKEDLYPLYQAWAKACGNKPLARKMLLSRLKSLGYARRKTKERWYALAMRAGARARYLGGQAESEHRAWLPRRPKFEC